MKQLLLEMERRGQSIWLDYLRRGMIASGELAQLVAGGIRGINSNLIVWEKVIAGSVDYDEALAASATEGLGAPETYLRLAAEDIRTTADMLRPAYERTGGEDGYACLEINPLLAHDTEGMVAEARRLYVLLDRPNAMVAIPATPEGLPAIEALIGEGIKVNCTMICSLETYEAAARSYLRGLRKWAAQGGDLRTVASVASFWVSPVDSAVNPVLEGERHAEGGQGRWAGSLRGQVAIALARVAYARLRQIFAAPEFLALRDQGARVQRLLWARAANKDPLYPEARYAKALMAKDTVIALSPSALVALKEEGKEGVAGEAKWDQAPEILQQLAAAKVDLKAVTDRLQEEGMKALMVSYERLIAHIEVQRGRLKLGLTRRPAASLGKTSLLVEEALGEMQRQRVISRIWAKDHTVWKPDPTEIANRLGWLILPGRMREHGAGLMAFAQEICGAGFKQAILLGMGGSSLAPEVLSSTFGPAEGHPQLSVLDSTVPSWVNRITQTIDPANTLFIASSKSGSTIEVASLFRYFWSLVQKVKGDQAGENFIAITDPQTSLQALAADHGFRHIFLNHADLGGRYSALSHFGLVPAALVGIDLGQLLHRGDAMAQSCVPCIPLPDNPGGWLGATLATSAKQGRNKLTLLLSPTIAALGLWIEQLIAESTGKEGKGIIPVVDEPLAAPSAYGPDRLFIFLRLEGDENSRLDDHLSALEKAGQPTVRIHLTDRYDLGAEFFRWEFATAIAGIGLGVQPFDQPNVQESKENTERTLAEYRVTGRLPRPVTEGSLPELLSQARPGDYVALMAYLEQTGEIDQALRDLRQAILLQHHLPSTVGYGPRYLHSTGQLHKGGPDSGLFVQLTTEAGQDLPIPGQSYSLGTLAAAQALGDWQSLRSRGQRAIRLHLGQEPGRELRGLLAQLE
ncbi:MAG: bifunctional transaldolase/phosoglucose isomerase [bacterium]